MSAKPTQPPSRLPRRFHEIWTALHEADRRAGSRQALARELGVSTQTLQRILVRGDVPSFGKKTSTRVTRSWARTIARLAVSLGREPQVWIEGVGIVWDPRVSRTVAASLAGRAARRPGGPGERTESSFPEAPARGTPRADAVLKQHPLRMAVVGSLPAEFETSGVPASPLVALALRWLRALLPTRPARCLGLTDGGATRALLSPDHETHLAFGVAATLPRRALGLTFVEIPGLFVPLRAVSIRRQVPSPPGGPPAPRSLPATGREGGPPAFRSWEDVLRAMRSGEVVPAAVRDDPGLDHLVGVAGIPLEQLLVIEEGEGTRLPEGALDAAPGGIVFVALASVCAAFESSLGQDPAHRSTVSSTEIEASRGALPSYPLSLALSPESSDLRETLEAARDDLLFRASSVAAAELYAGILLSMDPVAPWIFRGFPQAREVFQEVLCVRLSQALPPQKVFPLLPPAWHSVLHRTVARPVAAALHHCRSCSASLDEEHNRGVSDRYCRYCSDESGNLRPREDVQRILAGWMIHWQGPLAQEEAMRRAALLMQAMPAWSEN